jgi:hypothetical protein
MTYEKTSMARSKLHVNGTRFFTIPRPPSSLGLKRTTSDTSFYTMSIHVHSIRIVLVYVHDIMIVSDPMKWIEWSTS